MSDILDDMPHPKEQAQNEPPPATTAKSGDILDAMPHPKEAASKPQFDLSATYNQYVKPTLDAAGAEFKQHGLIPELAGAAGGALRGGAELGDLVALPSKFAADKLAAAVGMKNQSPTYAQQVQALLGPTKTPIADAVGHFLPSVAVNFSPRGVVKNALAQGAVNTALGEGTRLAQTGQFDPNEAAKQFGIGTAVGGALGIAGKGLEHYNLSKGGIDKGFKAGLPAKRLARDNAAELDAIAKQRAANLAAQPTAMQEAQQKLTQAAADREAALAKRQANYKEPKTETPKPILDHFEQAEQDAKDFGDRSRMIGASNAVRKGRKGGQGHNHANDGFVPGLQRLNGGTKGAADLKALVAEKMYRATVKNRNNFDAKSDDELIALMSHESEEVQQKAYETLERRHPDPPTNGGSGGGNHPEQLPPHLSTREQVNAMKHTNARPASEEEAGVLKDVVLAKTRRDRAYHQFESAFKQFVEKLNARGVIGPAYDKRPNFIHPNVDKQLRDAAAKAAGFSHLNVVPNTEASLIRDENNSAKFADYILKGKDDLQAGIEIKKLADKVAALQKQYEAVRDAARITTRLAEHESVRMDVNGHHYTVSNQTQNRYHPPADANATQAAAYKSDLAARRAAEQAKSPIVDMTPSRTKLADIIKGFNPNLAKILTGAPLDDKALQELGEKTGRLAEIKDFMTQFIEEEAGHGVTEYPLVVTKQTLETLWKAAGMANVKTPKQFINRAGQVFLNEMNMDIFKRSAQPEFVAELQRAIAKRALALQGIDLHHMSVDAMNDWAKLRDPAEIMASQHLTPQLKQALINVRQVRKEGAAMIKRYMDFIKDKDPKNKELLSVLHKELRLNWENPEFAHDPGSDILNAITTGTTSAISLGNMHMHALHAVEAAHANLVLAPGEFARAAHALAKDPRGTWAFAKSWNTKLPISNMSEDSMNPISNAVNKFQEPLTKWIKNQPIAHGIQQAISGQGIEGAKSGLTLITASEHAAKQMKYPGGGTALRNDMVKAMVNASAMNPETRLQAATHIWDFMDRSLGAGPSGYKVANIVDRSTVNFGAASRLIAPFSRSIIQQSRVQTGILKDLGKAMVSGDLPGIRTGMRQLMTSAIVLTSVAGANVIPWEVRNALANGTDKDRETLDKMEKFLDSAAFAGHHLGGWRMAHVQPTFFPLAKVGGNVVQASVKNLQTLDSSKSKDKSKIAAASMFAAKIGMNELADTMSLETARKIYNAYEEAHAHGTHTTNIYSESGMHLRGLGGQKVPLPFGLGEADERTKAKVIGKTVERTGETEAVLRAMFQPGESETEDQDQRNARNEYDAKMARKSRR